MNLVANINHCSCTAGDKVAIVCAPRDTYFPQAQWHELQRRLPGVQVRRCRSVTRAIVDVVAAIT
jgi:hypothetical protein